MLDTFALLTVRLRSLSLSRVEGRAGSLLVILSEAKNPFHSALRVDSAKHLAVVCNQYDRFFAEFTLSGTAEMLRSAQHDKRRAQNDNVRQFFISLLGHPGASRRAKKAILFASALESSRRRFPRITHRRQR